MLTLGSDATTMGPPSRLSSSRSMRFADEAMARLGPDAETIHPMWL